MRLITFSLIISSCAFSQAGPTQLAAASATSKQVELRWQGNAPAYTVERKSGTTWTALPEITAATLTDSAIDPMGTYTYRVRAGKAPALSAPSNEVTVGPPPTGHHLLLPVPSGVTPDEFGRGPRITLDSNGDPAILFAHRLEDRQTVFFLAWDRAHYKWRSPVTFGDIVTSGNGAPYALALVGGNRWAVVHRTSKDAEVRLALSNDNGLTWNSKTLLSGAESEFENVSFAVREGTGHLAVRRNEKLLYLTGSLEDDPAKWKQQMASMPDDRPVKPNFHLALDSTGKPAIALLAVNAAGDGIQPWFWQPGKAPVRIADTPSGGPDDSNIQLVFNGTHPWVAFMGKVDEDYFSKNHMLWTMSSQDGSTWSAPLWVGNDGGQTYDSRFSAASGSKGQSAITSGVSGGNLEGTRCGPPLLARSADLQKWTSCGPSAKADGLGVPASALAFAVNDKLYVVYQSTGGESSKVKNGLALWREP